MYSLAQKTAHRRASEFQSFFYHGFQRESEIDKASVTGAVELTGVAADCKWKRAVFPETCQCDECNQEYE
jgi:hypothetical protein